MSGERPVPEMADTPGDRVRRIDARRNLEAIIAAAVPLLTERPRASMQQIAAAAGLHRATVHRHFPSRDDLLDELRVRALDETLARVEDVLGSASASAGETLERATAAMIAVGDSYRLYRFTTWRNPENDGNTQVLGGYLIGLLTDAQAAGEVRSDLAIRQLVAALGGLVWALLPQVGDGVLTVEQAARTVSTLLAAPKA
ncbi:MAG: transcriptional regulator, TetR family [Solirubrobacterales bacterium]|nr:transcriptional regulator, TetR family [Solirubrobacterales bacterium]